MTKFFSLVVLLGVAQAAVAAPRTVDCLTDSRGGTALRFTVIETRPESEAGYDGLFEGSGEGRVVVEPVSPLKIQYPTQFDVVSQPSKRFSMNITQAALGQPFLFRLQALPQGATQFPAIIRYGRHALAYEATCEFR